jgi:ArsR family transcriptional regulator, arsenate/arsenite/antimonite-responsive transcriptional repressor
VDPGLAALRYHCIEQVEVNSVDATNSISTSRDRRPAKAARLTRMRRTAILKALADPKRFDLLERIARASCPLGCSEVLPALAISPATLSHHIKELETAGLIKVERQGKFHYLSLRPGILEALIGSLTSLTAERCLVPPKISE